MALNRIAAGMFAIVAGAAMVGACQDKPNAADNTKKNTADASGKTVTPMDQGQSQADVQITADIRKALMDSSTLSTNAKNVKVITNEGVVMLRGPVEGEAERDAVVREAKRVAGVKNVESQLEIAQK